MEWLRTALIGVLLAVVIALVAARLLKVIGTAVLALATLGLLVGAPMDAVLGGAAIGAVFYAAGAAVRALQGRRVDRAGSRPRRPATPTHPR